MHQKEKRKEGDGQSITETNLYEALPTPEGKYMKSVSGRQEQYTTLQGSISPDTVTVESEGSSESYQELVVLKSVNESPGESYEELVASEAYYENPAEVASSPCSHDNIYENPSSTGQEIHAFDASLSS